MLTPQTTYHMELGRFSFLLGPIVQLWLLRLFLLLHWTCNLCHLNRLFFLDSLISTTWIAKDLFGSLFPVFLSLFPITVQFCTDSNVMYLLLVWNFLPNSRYAYLLDVSNWIYCNQIKLIISTLMLPFFKFQFLSMALFPLSF